MSRSLSRAARALSSQQNLASAQAQSSPNQAKPVAQKPSAQLAPKPTQKLLRRGGSR